MQQQEDFHRILEAPLLDLFNWEGPALQNKVFSAYLQTLIGYFSKDLIRLNSSARTLKLECKNLCQNYTHSLIALRFNRIRRCLLKRQVHRARILCETVDLEPLTRTVWAAEFFFLFARVNEFEEKNKEACDLYKQAALLYDLHSCMKKSLRSILNSLVCYGRAEKENEVLPQYVGLYEQSLHHNDCIVAATCCHNISVTLFSIGARQSSLDWANKAIAELTGDTGSLNYFQCLLHRADTLLKMNRLWEAQRDIDEALISDHITIQGAAGKLQNKIDGTNNLNDNAIISPGWKKRESDPLINASLTESEDKLIGFLIQGNKSRQAIIQHLWNDGAEQEYLIDRFKQVLKRLRKKFGYPIRQKDGKYFIDFKIDLNQKVDCG